MPERSERPHVVMLVDNMIVGDSRVQKQAMSMAALGWRVTLVGRRLKEKDKKRQTFSGIPAHLVWIQTKAGSKPHVERSTLLRNPLAYNTNRKQRFKDAMATHAVGKARMHIDSLKLSARDTGLRRYWSRLNLLIARMRRRIVGTRVSASDSLRAKRQLANGRLDHVAIAWWKAVLGTRAWERLDPGIWDWEAAYAPVIDRLKPDLIHANDHRMLHVGARAKVRARIRGRDVKLVWDAHEWLAVLRSTVLPDSWHPAQVSLERAFAPHADAVVTVSEVLADILQTDFDLPERPTVVRNAPIMIGMRNPEKSVREVIGLAPDVPLMVYSGGISAARSVDTVVRALTELPGIHLVIVANSVAQPLVSELLALGTELGVSERVHTAPYVPVEQIVPYLASADAGVNTLLHLPNHEISLVTKYFEYAQARLPMIVSDVKVMAETTRRIGNGEVFHAGDPHDLAKAAHLVFEDLDRYRAAYDDPQLMESWTWEVQATALDALYRHVLQRPSS